MKSKFNLFDNKYCRRRRKTGMKRRTPRSWKKNLTTQKNKQRSEKVINEDLAVEEQLQRRQRQILKKRQSHLRMKIGQGGEGSCEGCSILHRKEKDNNAEVTEVEAEKIVRFSLF